MVRRRLGPRLERGYRSSPRGFSGAIFLIMEDKHLEGMTKNIPPESPPLEQRKEEHRVGASFPRDSGSVQTISAPEVGWLEKLVDTFQKPKFKYSALIAAGTAFFIAPLVIPLHHVEPPLRQWLYGLCLLIGLVLYMLTKLETLLYWIAETIDFFSSLIRGTIELVMEMRRAIGWTVLIVSALAVLRVWLSDLYYWIGDPLFMGSAWQIFITSPSATDSLVFIFLGLPVEIAVLCLTVWIWATLIRRRLRLHKPTRVRLYPEYVISVEDKKGQAVYTELFETEYLHDWNARRVRREFPSPLYSVRITKLISEHPLRDISPSNFMQLVDTYPAGVVKKAAEYETQCIASTSRAVRFLFRKHLLTLIVIFLLLFLLLLFMLAGPFYDLPSEHRFVWYLIGVSVLLVFLCTRVQTGSWLAALLVTFMGQGLMDATATIIENVHKERLAVARGWDPKCLQHNDPHLEFNLEHPRLCGWESRRELMKEVRNHRALERYVKEDIEKAFGVKGR